MTVNWAPGMTVTKLVLTAGGTPQEFLITPTEMAAGSKEISNLSNADYSVEIRNEEIVRGQVAVLVEGDAFLAPGDDLQAAFAAAAPGDVIVLAEGAEYPLRTKGNALSNTEGWRIDKDITIRGLSATERSVIYAETAFGTALLDFGATLSQVTFKNMRLTGLVGGPSGSASLAYFVNQKDAATITGLNFLNCEMDNFGGGMRFQSSGPHDIADFMMDRCVIHDFGTGYAIIHIQNGKADNITISNSTIYKFGREVLLHNAGDSQSVLITNCTFDDMVTGTSNRYIVDYTDARAVTDGITVANCIFGSASEFARGVRASDATAIEVEGTYRTDDFSPEVTPIHAGSTEYSGASTDLFADPATGDFTIKDAAFAGSGKAGDPRWY
jgi:hypothetical protein